MARLIYALNVSLDGYADHDIPGIVPDDALFRHFIEDVRGMTQCLYGRTMYEIMRYWDGDDWDQHDSQRPDLADYAAAWRAMHKWVVSSSLSEVGPNATRVTEDLAPSRAASRPRRQGTSRSPAPASPRA